MATSESEDFESADEDFEPDKSTTVAKPQDVQVNRQQITESNLNAPEQKHIMHTSKSIGSIDATGNYQVCAETEIKTCHQDLDFQEKTRSSDSIRTETGNSGNTDFQQVQQSVSATEHSEDKKGGACSTVTVKNDKEDVEKSTKKNRHAIADRQKQERQNKPKELKLGATKKLGTRVTSPPQKNLNLQEDITVKEDQPKDISEDSTDMHIPKSSDKQGSIQSSIVDSKLQEEFSSVFDKLSNTSNSPEKKPAETGGGWGWGGWGSSLLSTATASVSTLTSHVSQGISTVIETVEGGLGAPDPAELARQDLEAAQLIAELKEPTPPLEEESAAVGSSGNGEEGTGLFPLGSLFSGVSQLGKMVEHTGAKVLSGGLDTLETIGKKTMAVLQDGDPGLHKKRALFQPDRPILSQALREAKDKAEDEAKLVEEKQAARKVHFETLFDDFQGLIHLEALEMLSRQCEMKLQSSLLGLTGAELVSTQARLQTVRDECLLPDPDDLPDEPKVDLEETLTAAFAALPVPVTADKLLKVWGDVQSLASSSIATAEGEETEGIVVVHQRAIASLAQLTASCVEQFHRAGELLLVQECRNPQQEAAQLAQITLLESSMIEQLASNYSEALNSFGESAQPLITTVFLEASNSSTYVQDAFQLLVPVLQVGVV